MMTPFPVASNERRHLHVGLRKGAARGVIPSLALLALLSLSVLAPSARQIPWILAASCGPSYGAGSGPSPVVTAVSPNFGSSAGGTVVTITGSGFCNNSTAVNFGASAVGNFVLDDDTHIRATTPAESEGVVDVTVETNQGASPVTSADHFTYMPDSPAVFTPRKPTRLLDTRFNGGRLGPGGSVDLQLAGISVPSNSTAVVLNITATNTSTAGFFEVLPTGISPSSYTTIPWAKGQTVPDLIFMKLGNDGSITILNWLGSADVVVDLEGWFAPSNGGTSGEFVPVAPARITDTRSGSGQHNAGATLGPNTALDVQVAGVGGVPATGAAAVVLNVTVTDTTAASFITAYPTGTPRPNASNLNWTAGMTVPNRVVVPIGAAGKVTFYNGFGKADLIVDVNGYFTDTTASGGAYFAMTPIVIFTTRVGIGGNSTPMLPGSTIVVNVPTGGGVPVNGANAAVINLTVTNTTAASYLVVWPDGTSRPLASDLNWVAGQTVSNNVVVLLPANGKIDIFNGFGKTDVTVAGFGWFGS